MLQYIDVGESVVPDIDTLRSMQVLSNMTLAVMYALCLMPMYACAAISVIESFFKHVISIATNLNIENAQSRVIPRLI